MACVVLIALIMSSTLLLSGISEQNALLTEYEFYIADIWEEKENCIKQMGVFYDGSLYSENK